MDKEHNFQAVKKKLSTENMSKVVKITNVFIFLSVGFSSFREGAFSYFVLAIFIFWFVFDIAFFAVRKRYVTSFIFLIVLLAYLYAILL